MEKIICPFDLKTSIIDLNNNLKFKIVNLPSDSQIKFKKPLNSTGDHFIKINDVWDFNNIGVSNQSHLNLEIKLKEITNEMETKDIKIAKFLICGDCDKGPLGFVSNSNEYFLYY